jgi:hypothetical protein
MEHLLGLLLGGTVGYTPWFPGHFGIVEEREIDATVSATGLCLFI